MGAIGSRAAGDVVRSRVDAQETVRPGMVSLKTFTVTGAGIGPAYGMVRPGLASLKTFTVTGAGIGPAYGMVRPL